MQGGSASSLQAGMLLLHPGMLLLHPAFPPCHSSLNTTEENGVTEESRGNFVAIQLFPGEELQPGLFQMWEGG